MIYELSPSRKHRLVHMIVTLYGGYSDKVGPQSVRLFTLYSTVPAALNTGDRRGDIEWIERLRPESRGVRTANNDIWTRRTDLSQQERGFTVAVIAI